MRRLWILLLAAVLLAGGLPEVPAGAEATELRIAVSSDVVLPGQAVLISLTVPADGVCNIDVVDSRGGPVAHVVENRPVKAGENALYWNATWNGLAVPQGSWTLRLEMNGQTADTPVTIGRMVPMLIAPAAETDTVKTGRRVKVTFWASEAGTVILSAGEGDNRVRQETPVEAGAGSASLAMPLAPGAYTVEAVLTRRRKRGESAPVEALVEGDNVVTVCALILGGVFARDLDRALVCFRAGIREEDLLKTGLFAKQLRQLHAGLRVIKV